MRIKTFIATYLVLLCILFSSAGIASVYLLTSQMGMLREKSIGQYRTITASLERDIAFLYDRSTSLPLMSFSDAVDSLVRDYAIHYSRHNIRLSLTDLGTAHSGSFRDTEISFINQGDEGFIRISGSLAEPFEFYLLDYRLDISANLADVRSIQNILMLSAIIFSVVAAFALYFVLLSIFKPLEVVADASRKIASGQFGERISIKGQNELAQVAFDFNKMAEKLESQIRLLEEEATNKQQFVDNFAHEIRTPLTSIYGYAEYLQKAFLDEDETLESTEYIMSEARHMEQIANSLLELATLRNYTPVKNPISITRLFDDVKNSLRENNVQIDCHVNADTIEGQEDLIKSLLLNLCSNAIKSGSPTIVLTAKNEGHSTVISVSDSGCGVPEESLSKIMEPFYRADKARSRGQGGIGLGLTLCKQIADVHRAEINIDSREGMGTVVSIIFTNS